MLTEVHVRAPAKVNFNLKILSQRADGFHNIESVFQSVTLYDEIVVKVVPEEKSCKVICREMNLPVENTLLSAYKAFCSVVPEVVCGVIVTLTKHIPSGGGLGGGSSDAAAFIRALETVCGINLTIQQENEIAARTGSDVFFFLDAEKTGCAIVTGRGEVVKPIRSRTDLYLLLVFPGVHSSTREAYALVDTCKSVKMLKYPALALLEKVYNSSLSEWNFVNSFTPALVSRYPEIAGALSDIKEAGAGYVEMSGSGSTVYGIFGSRKEAEGARSLLANRWCGCIVVQPVQ
jgi:4-diphosphocytidyl-2-C-methyl-D-erythritol kinase